MEYRKKRTGRYNSRILLLAVLICFSILALIEIVYGQKQIRLEKERIALEQDNQKKVEELQKQLDEANAIIEEGNKAAETVETTERVPEVDTDSYVNPNAKPQEVSADNTQSQPSTVQKGETAVMDESRHDMQIVFLGDSILDSNRDQAGVAGLVGENCNARVYNMSIGGTTAALTTYQQYDFDNWQSSGLLGVVNAILGYLPSSYFAGEEAEWILEECDFSKTDYFVIEYGINDFLSGQIPQSRYLADGSTLAVDEVHTYSGALSTAVMLLQQNFPNAKILLVAPHNCQIFNGETYVGDGFSVNYGYGSLVEFARCTGYVYEQNKNKNVLLFNAFEDSGISAETWERYLEDGIHLTEEGRRLYADCIARILNGDFYPEE